MRRTWQTVSAVLAGCSALAIGAAPPVLAVPSLATAAADAQSVYRTINSERAAHALGPLHWNARLASAAHAHNLEMVRYDTLSHQLSGERSLGARVTAAGYAWRAVGENIGYTSDWSLTGILGVQRIMYREVAPNDWHRRNILSKTFRAVGVDVVMDAKHHEAWLTEVFAAPA
jgi:uncharacterized protein YkwD